MSIENIARTAVVAFAYLSSFAPLPNPVYAQEGQGVRVYTYPTCHRDGSNLISSLEVEVAGDLSRYPNGLTLTFTRPGYGPERAAILGANSTNRWASFVGNYRVLDTPNGIVTVMPLTNPIRLRLASGSSSVFDDQINFLCPAA